MSSYSISLSYVDYNFFSRLMVDWMALISLDLLPKSSVNSN